MFPTLEDYPPNHSFDLTAFQKEQPKMQFLPPFCFQNLNPISCSLLLQGLVNKDSNDLQKNLEKGGESNGLTDKGYSFFSPLLWNAILFTSEWEIEKKNILILLQYPIDLNLLSLCGLSLYHFYLLETMLFPQYFHKLEWWTKFPMVDVNSPVIIYGEKNNRSLKIYHPIEWVKEICAKNEIPNYREKEILSLLFARGASCYYGGSEFLPPDPMDWENEYLMERLMKQWDVKSKEQLKFRIQQKEGWNSSVQETIQQFLYQESGISPMNTMNMAPLESVPSNHCLEFSGSPGKISGFHASFLEPIFKKHSYPFTGEPVSPEQVNFYLKKTQENWFPREEFYIKEIIETFPKNCLNNEMILPKDRFEFALQKLHDWISAFFPYTRIYKLKNKKEQVFRFLCIQMNRGDFTFEAFERCHEGISWREQFFWAAHESLPDTYIFSTRLEELIGLIEIYDLFQTSPFHLQFPAARDFIESDSSEHPLIKLYQEEYEVSFLQVYYLPF